MTEERMTTATDTSVREDELLTAEQVAERMGLDPERGAFVVRILTAAGDGPAAAGKPTDFYWSSAVDKWLSEPYTSVRVEAEVVASVLVAWAKPHRPRTEPTPSNGQAVECARWCAYGAGHPGELWREDQVCYGEPARVDLSLEDELADGGTDYLEVFPAQGPCLPGEVVLMHNENDQTRLTPFEAQRLVDALQHALREVSA